LQNDTLAQELVRSRARLAELDTLQADNVRLNEKLVHQQIDDYELKRLRGEARDVFRLRGEVTSLRDIRQENQKLAAQMQQLSNEVLIANQNADFAWRNFRAATRPTKPSNESTEFVRQREEGSNLAVLPRNQPSRAESAAFPPDLGRMTTPRFGQVTPGPGQAAPAPNNPEQPSPENSLMPADHAGFSKQTCASCHNGINTQNGIQSVGLLHAAETFLSRR
jgi:hypothetical protein